MFGSWMQNEKTRIERIEFRCFFNSMGMKIILFLYRLKWLNAQFQILPNLHQNVNAHLTNSRFFSFFLLWMVP
jgi:hypothetical protein